MDVIARDVAAAEVAKWIDYKKISSKKQEAQKDSIDSLIDGFADGSLVLGKDFSIKQILKFPTDGELKIETLEYKPRLKIETIHHHLQGVKPGDADGRVCAYIAALTSKPKDLIKKLDTEDYGTAQAIAIFFL